ncbi:MAG: hypothetical protein HKN87_19940 [Saprospiraceae bacterium]|nr:hypothetical protein [Saprospiraceae bacterium]
MINCFFGIQKIIQDLRSAYINKYGAIPTIRAGLHGGQVIVTWIGELRKEIVYVGDVLNTTARIQEKCKRLGKDFLISEKLLFKMKNSEGLEAQFAEETVLRGKKKLIRLYSIEMAT